MYCYHRFYYFIYSSPPPPQPQSSRPHRMAGAGATHSGHEIERESVSYVQCEPVPCRAAVRHPQLMFSRAALPLWCFLFYALGAQEHGGYAEAAGDERQRKNALFQRLQFSSRCPLQSLQNSREKFWRQAGGEKEAAARNGKGRRGARAPNCSRVLTATRRC